MSGAAPACHTDPVTGAGLATRAHAARTALLRGTGPVPLSRWAWTADVFLVAFFAAGLVVRCLVRARGPRFVDPTAPLGPFEGDVPQPPPGVDPYLSPAVVVHPWELVLALLCGLPLAVRRRYPLTRLPGDG